MTDTPKDTGGPILRADGGPAFPKAAEFDAFGNVLRDGLSIRDYFAAAALPAIIAACTEAAKLGGGPVPKGYEVKGAYEIADDALKERAK